MSFQYKPSDQGFTLVELLITLAVSGVIMTGVYTAFKAQQDSYLAQEQVAELQQNIRAGLDIMTREIRMAGFDPDNRGQADITTANANTLLFSLVADNDGIDNVNADGDGDTSTGADEPGELMTLQFDLYDAYGDGDTDLGRQEGGIKRALAENIDNLEFFYTLEDGTQTITPADPSDIRSVEISILARAHRPDRNYTNNETYTSASGVDWTPATPDNFRRRFQTMTVQCRNMGL